MPPIVIAAAIAAGGGLTAAEISSSATDHAGERSADAATQALAFQRQQAEADYQNQEVNRKANYDQFAARDQRIGTLGEAVGLPARQTPAYVPSVDPQYVHNGGTPPTAGAVTTPPGATQRTPPGATPSAAPASSEPTVQLKSPTGQISSVPRSQVLHYLSLGASYV